MEAFRQALGMEQITSSNSGPPNALLETTASTSSRRVNVISNRSSRLQSSSLDDSTATTNTQQFGAPPDHIRQQGSGDTIDDFDLPIDPDFIEFLNTLENEPMGGYDWEENIFSNQDSDSLTNLLAEELQLPTAGLPFKNNNDRNRGLERPGDPD
jgi:hypothetical protein